MAYDPGDLPLFSSILHPTDFSVASESAFAHALAIALTDTAHLAILHAGGSPQDWHEFPEVRGTLVRWGLLEPGVSPAEVKEKLALSVKKVRTEESDPLAAILDYLDGHPVDLLVMATRGVRGLARWYAPSLAEALTRLAKLPALLVPAGASGFVSDRDGSVSLRRILVPVDHAPGAAPAVGFVEHAAHVLAEVDATLLHVGDEPSPEVALPDEPRCAWDAVRKEGPVVETILDTAREIDVDLIVMVTDGRDGFLDILRGSHTDRVLQHTPVPILSLPAGWSAPLSTGPGQPISRLAEDARARTDRVTRAMFRSVAKAAHPDAGGDGDGALLDRAIRARDAGDLRELASLADEAEQPPPPRPEEG